MTPLLAGYWQEAGEDTAAQIATATGLDPVEWRVTDPHLREKIEQASFSFCAATNATTTMQLGDALAQLRRELIAGLVDEGETLGQLRKRVQSVFTSAEKHRAERIAATEASRAVHAAQLESAKESGVVQGQKWLLSSDACPLCHKIATETGIVPLGGEFAKVGDHPEYSSVRYPPAHPNCQCSTELVLIDEYLGLGQEAQDAAQAAPEPTAEAPPASTPHPEAPPRQPKPEGRPEPAPHPDTFAQPTKPKPKKPAAPRATFPKDPEKLELVKKLGGSTGAELVKDPKSGRLYVRKKGNNPGHLREETHADAAYQALGVPVPRFKLYETDGGPVKLSEFHQGQTLAELKRSDPAAYAAAVKQVQKHFAADALLGNWDVVGRSFDNILVTDKGQVLRIDNGGSLRYRAQGAKKGSSQWPGDELGELQSLRQSHINPQAADVFGSLTDKEVAKQAKALLKKRAKLLASLPAELKPALEHRLTKLDEWVKAASLPKAKPPAGTAFTELGRPVSGSERKAAAEWLQTHLGPAYHAATSAEREAIDYYKGSGYDSINKALRQGRTPPKAKAIESLQRKSKVPADLVVYRGIRNRSEAGILGSDHAQHVGSYVADKGFISASLNWESSYGGFTTSHGVLFRFTVPKGTAAAKGTDYEYELVLPRNHQLKITRYVGLTNGTVPTFDAEFEPIP
jgi:hypothetical protein